MMSFMTLIRKNTTTLHSAAEHSGFIKRIIDGNASKESYIEYLFNLAAMYEAIERVITVHAEHEAVKNFVTPELYRYELIKEDLTFLTGDKLKDMVLLPSTEAFLVRLKEIETSQPELIIAYAYTRFIADLFGGRTFASLLSTHYKVEKEGLNYYRCDQIKDIRAYVMNYAQKIDEINLSEERKQAILHEVSLAYIYNLAISNELEAKLYLN